MSATDTEEGESGHNIQGESGENGPKQFSGAWTA